MASKDFRRQLEGYGLTTAQILYRLPDHPSVLQTFVWQDYDVCPRFPVLNRFLAFWLEKLEGGKGTGLVAAIDPVAGAESAVGISLDDLAGEQVAGGSLIRQRRDPVDHLGPVAVEEAARHRRIAGIGDLLRRRGDVDERVAGDLGGPVIQDDRVVGVAFQGIAGLENTGFFIPPPVIQRTSGTSLWFGVEIGPHFCASLTCCLSRICTSVRCWSLRCSSSILKFCSVTR